MRAQRGATRVASLVGLLVFAAACGSAVPGPSGPAGSAGTPADPVEETGSAFGTDYFTTAANPLNLSLTPDAGKVVTARVTPAGGSVSATGADGTTFVLDVPPAALVGEVDIVLTPIDRVEGWPEAPGNSAAVLMAPDGLEFAVPGRLTITPAQPVGDAIGSPFTFHRNGDDAHLVLSEHDVAGIAMPVDHFSGKGFVWNVQDSFWTTLQRYRQQEVEDRLQHRMAQEAGRIAADQKAGRVPDKTFIQLVDELAAEWERDVINRRLQLASASCKDAKHALSGYSAWNRQMQLLGIEGHDIDPPPNLMNLVRYVCAEEATRLCFETGDVERLVSVLLRDQQSLEVIAQSSGGLTARYLDACARFDLKIEHHTEALLSPSPKYEMTADIEVTVPLRWEASDASGLLGMLKGEALGQITGTTAVAGPCSIELSPGAADAPYKVDVERIKFINTGPEATTIRLQDVELKLTEGHFTASGTISCPRVPPAPLPIVDIPFVFWNNPPEKMTGWTPDGHPTIATKDFARTLSAGIVGTETIDMELIHTPGPMPARPDSP